MAVAAGGDGEDGAAAAAGEVGASGGAAVGRASPAIRASFVAAVVAGQ